MKIRRFAAVSALTAVLFLQLFSEKVMAEEGPGELYALSAVLMDGDTGRILYEKEGEQPLPNASTTKVMTCILALENANKEDVVTVSSKAAAQPDVQLHMEKGEQYYLGDLLYSLMLKSHNDTAVAIAEHIGGSVENFALLMNRKAEEIGCKNTHFVTPNGLDKEDSGGVHHTTAKDLALLMRYAIKNEEFLKITETMDYTFTDVSGKRSFSLRNTNALLEMMDGVLAGKTGYTGNAGYCYVCACNVNGKTFVVSLLGCGWPGHKTYKWSDTKALLSYGNKMYDYKKIWKLPVSHAVFVKDGIISRPGEKVYLNGLCKISSDDKKRQVLAKPEEKITCQICLPKEIEAPIKRGERLGQLSYYVGTYRLCSYPVIAEKAVEKVTYQWYLEKVFHDYFH